MSAPSFWDDGRKAQILVQERAETGRMVGTLNDLVKRAAHGAGFELAGIAPVRDFDELAYFPAWIDAGQRGGQGQESEMTTHHLFLPLRGAGHSLKPGLAVAEVVAADPVIAGAGAPMTAAGPDLPEKVWPSSTI